MGIAMTSLIFGRHERAIGAFERMAEARFPLLPFLLHLEMLDPLWQYPRFLALYESLRLPESALRYRRKKK